MNYNIQISQPACVKHGLTLQEAVICSGLKSMFGSGSIEEFIHEGKSYKWVAPAKLLSDLPILDIKKRRINEVIKGLEDKGFVERCPINQQLAKAYYRPTPKFDLLFEEKTPKG